MKPFFIATILAALVTSSHADPQEDIRLISREASRIETDMYHRLPNIDERDPALKTLAADASTATAAVKQALDTQPLLAELRTKRDAAFAQLTIAHDKGDNLDKQTAQEAYSKANTELSVRGREIPEIKQLIDKATETEAAYIQRKEAAYAAQPETAEMAQKVAELLARALALKEPVKTPTVPPSNE